MNEINPNELLSQLQNLAKQAQAGASSPSIESANTDNSVQFSELMKNSINEVNAQQAKGAEAARAFELGDPNMPLSEVMVEMQKARVSFEALKQVRNQLVEAYREVMNMPL